MAPKNTSHSFLPKNRAKKKNEKIFFRKVKTKKEKRITMPISIMLPNVTDAAVKESATSYRLHVNGAD